MQQQRYFRALPILLLSSLLVVQQTLVVSSISSSSNQQHIKPPPPPPRLSSSDIKNSTQSSSSSLTSNNNKNMSESSASSSRNNPLQKFTLTNQRKNEILSKLSTLASHSTRLQQMSYDEQLQIIEEIKTQIRSKKWHYSYEEEDDDNDNDGDTTTTHYKNPVSFGDYEAALLQLSPLPCKDKEIVDSAEVKKYKAWSRFTITYTSLGCLKVFEEKIRYLMNEQNVYKSSNACTGNGMGMKCNAPRLIRNVQPLFGKTDRSDNEQYYIHGRKSMPFLLTNFEVWTKRDQKKVDPIKNNDDEEEMKMLMDNEQPPAQQTEEGGVNLVLGAGNQSNLSLIDILHGIFVHPRKPILLKHHPLRPFLYHPLNEILKPLIERDLLYAIDDYGVDFTQELLSQKEITNVHLTGALSTSTAIKKVYSQTRPHLSKRDIESRITSELGCATPVLITPAKYTKTELKNCIINIVTGKKMFAGSNCLGSQVIIMSESWEQKYEFRTLLKEVMKNTYTDPSYYPGSLAKVKEFLSKYSADMVEQIRSKMIPRSRFQKEEMNYTDKELSSWSNDHHPYIIECGVAGSKDFNGYAIQNEIFGPVLAIVEVPDASINSASDNNLQHESPEINFLVNSAVPFVNNKSNIYGSLSCQLMYPTMRNNSLFRSYKQMEDQLKKHVISKLHYGTVTVNTNPFSGYGAVGFGGQWGAHPKDKDGHSGNGFVGNGYGLQNVDKTVVYGTRLSIPVFIQRQYLLPSFCFDAVCNLCILQSKIQSFVRTFIK